MNASIKRRGDAACAVALCVLTCSALGIRLFRLDAQSLWIDECVTVARAAWDLGKKFLLSSYTPPLHQTFLHYWMKLGQSDFWVRLPSALAGALSVPLTFLIAQRLFGTMYTSQHAQSGPTDRRGLAVPWYAGLLMMISPLHMYYSQEAKSYSFAVLFGLLSLWSFLRLVQEHSERPQDWVLYFCATSLGIASHYSVAYVLILENVWVLLGPGRRMVSLRRWLLVQTVLGSVVVLPLLTIHFFPTTRMVREHLPDVLRRPFDPFSIPYFFYAFSVGFSLGPTLAELHTTPVSSLVATHGAVVGLVAVVFFVAFFIGVVSGRPRRSIIFVVLWLAVPLCLSIVASLKVGTIIHVRFATIALPAYVILVAAGLAFTRSRLLRVPLVTGIVGFSLVSDGNYFFVPAYFREDARSAAAEVMQRERKGDVIVGVSSYFMRHAFSYYYKGQCPVVTFPFDVMAHEHSIQERIMPGISEAHRVWYVESRRWETDPQGRLKQYLDRDLKVQEEHDLPGVRVLLYKDQGFKKGELPPTL